MQNKTPPPLPPPTVDYATPGPYQNAWPDHVAVPILSPRIAVHVWAIALAMLMTTVLGIPKLESVFKDFKVELPAITKSTLIVSRMFTSWILCILFALFAIGLPFLLSAMLGLGAPTKDDIKRREIWMCRGLRLLALITVVWLAIAMILPYATLIQSMSSPSKH